MNARLMAASSLGGFALAAILFSVPFSGQIRAQSDASSQANGLFSGLRVGQMVELWGDTLGPYIRTYEDAAGKAQMKHKIKEIGNDYIVLEFDDKDVTGSLVEYRLPVYHLTQVVHIGKSSKPGAPGADDTRPDRKPSTPDKKPGMTKKKN